MLANLLFAHCPPVRLCPRPFNLMPAISAAIYSSCISLNPRHLSLSRASTIHSTIILSRLLMVQNFE